MLAHSVLRSPYPTYQLLLYLLSTLGFRYLLQQINTQAAAASPKLKNLMSLLDLRLKHECPQAYHALRPYQVILHAFYEDYLKTLGMMGLMRDKGLALLDMLVVEGEVALQRLLVQVIARQWGEQIEKRVQDMKQGRGVEQFKAYL